MNKKSKKNKNFFFCLHFPHWPVEPLKIMLLHDSDKIYQIIEIFRFGWTPDAFHPTYFLKPLFKKEDWSKLERTNEEASI